MKCLLFLGSSCIYPKLGPQPMKEEYLLTGPLEETNWPYALAKLASIEMCLIYNWQYSARYMAVMPANHYSAKDNYHPTNNHVIPPLISKFHEAKEAGAPAATVCGIGTHQREFLYIDDMADACVHLMNLPDEQLVPLLGQDPNDGLASLLNIGVGHDVTILELDNTVSEPVGYKGKMNFDATKADGTPPKLLDVGRLTALVYTAKTTLKVGLTVAYQDFLSRREL